VAAPVADPAPQLAWEARQRRPAGIAAILAAVLTLGGTLWNQAIYRDVPRAGFLESLGSAVQQGPVGQEESVRVAFYQFYSDHATEVLASSVVRALGLLALGWAITFLGAATRARKPDFAKPLVYAALVGAVLSALGAVLNSIGVDSAISNFLDGPRTVDEAADVGGESLLVTAGLIGLVGQLALAIGVVLVCMNAMRVGLLTRFLGVLGIITGALIVIPIGPLPVVQSFFLFALGLLMLGAIPGGAPPAWRTGNAEAWPSQQQAAEARRRQAEARRAGSAPAEPEELEAPEPVATGTPHPSSKKRKRKRRG
jgi:hypothetical protein